MTKAVKGKVIDFAFEPERSPYHFAVETRGSDSVRIDERFSWPPNAPIEARAPILKAVLDGYRWSRICDPARSEFNRRLHAEGLPAGRWKSDEATLLTPYFGKELILLAWAVEDADPTLIPNMIANWLGLAPEERWWLYTTINATSGHPEHGRDRGWRKAIKIAFGENPADAPPSTLVELGQDGVRLPLPADFPYERIELTGDIESAEVSKENEAQRASVQAEKSKIARRRRTRAQMPLLPESRA